MSAVLAARGHYDGGGDDDDEGNSDNNISDPRHVSDATGGTPAREHLVLDGRSDGVDAGTVRLWANVMAAETTRSGMTSVRRLGGEGGNCFGSEEEINLSLSFFLSFMCVYSSLRCLFFSLGGEFPSPWGIFFLLIETKNRKRSLRTISGN